MGFCFDYRKFCMEVREGDGGNGVTVAAESDPSRPDTTAPVPEGGGPVGSAAVAAKKKRGRPRKYGPDGKLNVAALSRKAISGSELALAVAPAAVIDFSAAKRGKVRPASWLSKTKYEGESLAEWVPCSVGGNFTPHIITVNSGEDITMKILSFSQQGPRAICILSANGVISSVTLRQPNSSGGTLTYEGRFEILSLSGSFMPSDNAGARSRTGGMSVSLASSDGRVFGGGVVGLLVAASSIQVVVGSFISGNQHEQKSKKLKQDIVLPVSALPISPVELKSYMTTTTTTTTSSFRAETWSPLGLDLRSQPTDMNVS
ncbi:AT-hook motif nuclear-localized protein 1-like [Cucurbita pepo subsp. pepo]|uniref:AT-hook motif nuclear-localized protein 1-like n=1 Tax=Cucurbita pepo subsp. pepo TaxID=3664 RepID=UPI000C9D7D4A|nr:AT-hook motif nuclear-localized protein 1-like [Cucurbita pepo subsp. pepo]